MSEDKKKNIFIYESVANALVIKDMINIYKNFLKENPDLQKEGYLEAAIKTMDVIDDSATKLLRNINKEYVKEVEKKLNERKSRLYS